MVPLTGHLVLPDPLGNGRPAPRLRCPGALAPDQPRTAGPRDSPSRGPHPWTSNQRLVKGDMSGSPLTPREPLCPCFPLRGDHQGGLRLEPLHQNTSASQWTLRRCPSPPPGQCKWLQARIQESYV